MLSIISLLSALDASRAVLSYEEGRKYCKFEYMHYAEAREHEIRVNIVDCIGEEEFLEGVGVCEKCFLFGIVRVRDLN